MSTPVASLVYITAVVLEALLLFVFKVAPLTLGTVVVFVVAWFGGLTFIPGALGNRRRGSGKNA